MEAIKQLFCQGRLMQAFLAPLMLFAALNGMPAAAPAEQTQPLEPPVVFAIEVPAEETEQAIEVWKAPHVPTRSNDGFNKAKQVAFAKAVYEIAKHYEDSTGVPAIVVTAQACFETGWGASSAARNRNNIFGIASGKREFKTIATDELDYETPRKTVDDCFSYYYQLLQGSGYDYAKKTGEFNDWLQAFRDTGYHESGTTYDTTMRQVKNLLINWGVVSDVVR